MKVDVFVSLSIRTLYYILSLNFEKFCNITIIVPVADPGFPIGGGANPWGGANLQCIHFLVKTYAKTKEIDPVGGACAGSSPPLDLPICTYCELPYWLLIRIKNCIVYKLLELNYNQTKSTAKNLFKMCDFWTYCVNLVVLIRQGGYCESQILKELGNRHNQGTMSAMLQRL